MPKVLPPKFGPGSRLEKEYAAGIKKIVRRVLQPVHEPETLTEFLARIAERSQQEDIRRASETLAERMVKWTNTGNVKTWREAAARSMQSQKLYRLLEKEMQGATGEAVRRIIQQNARLISSIPLEAATRLTDEVTKAQQRGARAGTIAKMMKARFPELVRSRVNLVARTEVSKAASSLTQARAEELDLPCYIWDTSSDVRVRPSHKNMQGVVCFWNDPPAPEALIGVKSSLGAYNVGNCPNDRCGPLVMLTLDDVQWPARVAHHGAIHQMTRVDFKARFASAGLQTHEAA
jgi:SPP1 gp7 family putative phage head morphogenesis protein